MITNKRTTNQYKMILDYLHSTESHPTADDIYKEVKKKLPQISLGTVYRNLKKMVNNGDCIECVHEKVTHYDINTTSHHHFICLSCNALYDLKRHAVEINKHNIPKHIVGSVSRFEGYIYGYCTHCQKKGENI